MQNSILMNIIIHKKSNEFLLDLPTCAQLVIISLHFVKCDYFFAHQFIFRSFAFFEICMRASQNLYESMFNAIVSTKMRFFDVNPTGRILNRFSKDIGYLKFLSCRHIQKLLIFFTKPNLLLSFSD